MSSSLRKLVGAVALLVLVVAYAFLAVAAAAVMQMHTTSKLVELAFYFVAGLLWTLPAGWIIWWMQRPGSGSA